MKALFVNWTELQVRGSGKTVSTSDKQVARCLILLWILKKYAIKHNKQTTDIDVSVHVHVWLLDGAIEDWVVPSTGDNVYVHIAA